MSTKESRKEIVVRAKVLFIAFACIGLVLVARTFQLQYIQGSKYRAMGEKHGTKTMEIEASRGNILAEDGRLLATSVPIYDLHFDFVAMDELLFKDSLENLSKGLASVFPEKTASEFRSFIVNGKNKNKRFALLKRGVTYQQLQKIKGLPIINKGRNKSGLVVETRYRREMPFRMLAKRTIGYIIPGVKPVGIEGAFDKLLAGARGKRLMQRVAGGQLWIPIDVESDIEPMHGKDIVTTLRVDVQDVAESALEKALIMHNAKHGCAIVMETKTGKIIAMANLGKDNKTGQYSEDLNYAIGESVEPGSTFKVASLCVGFENGDFDLQTKINMHGGSFSILGRPIKDSHKGEYEGNVKKALAVSSNAAITELVYNTYKNKKNQFYKTIEQFRLTQPLGLEISGEPKPTFPNPNGSYFHPQSLVSNAFGYEMKITPLQLLAFYNCIANRGRYMKPYLVSEIQQFGKSIQTFEPVVLQENTMKASTIDMAFEMMRAVVDSSFGTASKELKNPYYSVAGKTGTAVIYDGTPTGSPRKYRASFAGFFPADTPLYSCIVVITEPSNGAYYASTVAAPVFREIADILMAWEKSRPQPSKIVQYPTNRYELLSGSTKAMNSTLKAFGFNAQYDETSNWSSDYWDSIGKVHQLKPKNQRSGMVPDVMGMGLTDAIFLLESRGYQVIPKGRGKVVAQSVAPHSKLPLRSTIQIELK
jgi:cell division protein FtsI (penicillin-binding protein 3)